MVAVTVNGNIETIFQLQENTHTGAEFLSYAQADLFFATSDVPRNIYGTLLKRIRMAITTRNLKNIKTNLELGREVKVVWSMGLTGNLPFDPSKWQWGSTNKTMECLFFNYSAKLQRNRLFEKLT